MARLTLRCMANVMFYSYIEVPDEEVESFIEDYADTTLNEYHLQEAKVLEEIFQGMDDSSEEYTDVDIYTIEKQ